MTLNNTEASAVNTLARFLLELDGEHEPVLPEQARAALGDLAAAAHKKLAAGTTREQVRAGAWRIGLPGAAPVAAPVSDLDPVLMAGDPALTARTVRQVFGVCGAVLATVNAASRTRSHCPYPVGHTVGGCQRDRVAAADDGTAASDVYAGAVCGETFTDEHGFDEVCTEPPQHTKGGCRDAHAG